MKYTLRLFKEKLIKKAIDVDELGREMVYECTIEMKIPTIEDIKNLFEKKFNLSIDEYGPREIELMVYCRLQSIDEFLYDNINIYLKEEDWKSFNRNENINKIIN